MRTLGFIMLFLVTASFVGKPKAEKKVEVTTFLTSAICGECKERIEKELNYTKGVVYAELNMDTKEVTVKYKTKFLTEQDVKNVVAGVGYDAGDTKRNEEAFNKLPKCCKSEGHCSRD